MSIQGLRVEEIKYSRYSQIARFVSALRPTTEFHLADIEKVTEDGATPGILNLRSGTFKYLDLSISLEEMAFLAQRMQLSLPSLNGFAIRLGSIHIKESDAKFKQDTRAIWEGVARMYSQRTDKEPLSLTLFTDYFCLYFSRKKLVTQAERSSSGIGPTTGKYDSLCPKMKQILMKHLFV